jgi:methyl-accepting chemotaxis protein
MKNLKIWQKLALLAAVFTIPFLVVTWQLLSTVDTQGVAFARQERDGLEAVLPLLRVGQDLQRQRNLADRVLAGNAAQRPALQATSAQVQADLRAMDGIELHDVPAARWAGLRDRASELAAGTARRSAEASLREHAELIAEDTSLAGAIADQSRLTLDPERNSYYLISVLLMQGPELSEVLSRTQALGASVLASGNATPEQLERLRGFASLAEASGQRLDDAVGKAIAFDPSLRPRLQQRAKATTAEVRQTRDFIAMLVAGQADDAARAGLPATGSVAALQAVVAPALRELLERRVARYEHQLWEIVGWAGVGILLALGFGLYIVRDITVPLRQAVGVADQIAVGNLNVDAIAADRRDEIGSLSRAFGRMITSLREQVLLVQDIADGDLTGSIKPASANDDMGNALQEMVSHLSSLVSEVHKSGIQVNTSATQISATAREQHSTASEIAATTTQIGATSKQISATSKELVRTMTEVAGAAEQSATLAGSGQVGLTQMEETMHRVMEATGSINAKLAVLNEKAGNITQVVTTITRVADQTNLLSLNAAIEAEKAGEYGRGFSVVATEIRRLADQTAVATYDIEQMVREIQSAVSAGVMGMDKFSEEVRRGMDEVSTVGTQLSQIIHQVQQMAPRCEAASEGMRAQATGAEQITQALSQLSEAALQTVESLRQSNQAIDGLHQSATGLREGVSRFKLGG